MKKLLAYITAGIIGLWLATIFVPGVVIELFEDSSFLGIPLNAVWQIIVLVGIIIGLLNYFVKPILNTIAIPLRIITLGLFSFVINVVLISVVDMAFKELFVPLWLPLFFTTLIIWVLNTLLKFIIKD